MKKFFMYDPEGDGFTTHETEESALDAAKKAISQCLDADGWHEDVGRIVVGTITHQSTKTNVAKKVGEVDEDGYDESGQEWISEFDETCDYEMSRKS